MRPENYDLCIKLHAFSEKNNYLKKKEQELMHKNMKLLII